jgi:hypothetical protein
MLIIVTKKQKQKYESEIISNFLKNYDYGATITALEELKKENNALKEENEFNKKIVEALFIVKEFIK